MSRARNEEQRILSKEEYDLVSQTRQDAMKDLADKDLSELIKQLRERRDRARAIANRQRREVRGKAAPSGKTPATDDSGSKQKRDCLAAALKRANKEADRRQTRAVNSDLVANAKRARQTKQSAENSAPEKPSTRTAHKGMQSLPNEDAPPSGAFDSQGYRPVLERSAKAR